MSNFWTKLKMCANRTAGKGAGFHRALSARGARLGFPLLLLFALWLGAASSVQAAEKFCSEAPFNGVIDGNVLMTSPVQITIDTTCTFQNWPQSKPLTATINFQTNDPSIYLIIFDNVYYTGNMACANIDHKIWFSNGSYYGSNNSCQDLFIPIEKIDKQNPAGQTTASIGVPFTYTLTIPVMYDPATGTSSDFPSANDLGNIRITDDLTATGAALTLVNLNAYYKDSGTPVPAINLGDDKHLYFLLPDILRSEQIVVEITVVLDDTVTNVAGTQFINTAKWLFSRSIDVDEDGVIEPGEFYEPLPGEWGATQPLTIAEPSLVVNKTSNATALNVTDTATFTIDVQNTGGSDVWNATILDQLPAGMCGTDPRTALSAEIVAAGGAPGSGLTLAPADYAATYSGCQLTLTMLTAAAKIAPEQHLIITYQTQLDPGFINDGAILTNVAGATQWFSGSNSSGRTYSKILTDGTPTLIDHQDSQTVTAALHGYYFEKTVANLTSQANPTTTASPGDTLRYTLRLFNVDQAINGITISDILDPNSFVLTSFGNVTLPAGATHTYNAATGQLVISGSPAPLNIALGDELVFTFDITLKSTLTNGTAVLNQAGIIAAGNFAGLSDDPHLNGVASPDVVGDEDPTSVVIQAPGPLAKANIQASATIGEQFSYRLTVPATATAVPLYDVRILDDLGPSAADMRFVSARVIAGGSWTPLNTGTATALVIEDTITGIDIPANSQAVIEVTVELLNTVTNNRGLVFNNSAVYTYNRANGVDATQMTGGAGSTANMTVVEPAVTAASKAVRFVTPAGKLATDPARVGDVLEYVVTIPNSGNATAFDSNVVDTLPANVALIPDSATAQINGVAVSGFIVNPATLSGGALAWGRQNGDDSLDIPAGQALVLTYQVTMVSVTGAPIYNSVYVDWTSLLGANAGERTGAGCPAVDALNDYCFGPATVPINTVDATSIAKAVVGDSYAETPASTTNAIVRVGDTVTYELTLQLQEYTTQNVVVEDALPAGLALESVAITAGPNFTYTLAAQPAAGATGTLRWEFGDITNAPSSNGTPLDALVIRYVAKVVIAAPPVGVDYDPSILRDNRATLSYTGGDPLLFPARLTATVRVDVRQPQMRAISKVDLGSGRVGTGTLADPYRVNIASDVMNFQLSSCNDGLAPAYRAQITDVLASQLDETSITPPLVSVGGTTLTAGTGYIYTPPAGRGGTMSFLLSTPINPGQCATIAYSSGFHTDLTSQTSWSNQAQLPQYESLPADGRLYAAADLAQVWMTNVVGVNPLAKSLLSPPTATIGAEVVYQIKVPAVPMNAALDNVEVNDTLSPTLVFVSATDGTGPLTNTSLVAGQVTLAIGTIAAGEEAVITLIARVVNNDQANAGTSFANTASYTYTDIPVGTLTSGSSAALTIVEPAVTITQSVNPATPPQVGDSLTYTVQLTAAAGANFSSVFDTTLVDTMSLGLAYLPGSARVGGVAVEPGVSGDGVNTVQALSWAGGIDIPAGSTVTVTYAVQVLGTVVAGQTLTNSVTAQWTGLDGVNADERTGSGTPAYNDYLVTAAAPPLTIPVPLLTMQKIVTRLVGITELPGAIANPGDRLHYTIVIQNPSAIRLENFSLVDELDRLNATPRFQPGSLGVVSLPVGVSTINNGTLSITGLNIGPNETLTIVFEALLKTELKSGTIVLNQAELQGLWTTPILSDDPNLPGTANPTQTVIPANGVVYDAESRQPLAGVTLTLRLAATGSALPASCFVDPSQQNQVTPATGTYKFDLQFDATNCPDGADYLLAVTAAPTGYVAEASLLILPTTSGATAAYAVPVCAADAIPATDQCEAQTSTTAPTTAVTTYYLHLTLDATANQIFNNHIPVDPQIEEKISISKKSSLLNVTRGQLVPYTITVKNTLRSALPALGIVDTLPPGFKYVEGSSRFDEIPLEPVMNGRQLRWDNLVIGYKQAHTIKLLLLVSAGVAEGEFVNRAHVRNIDTNATISEEATATVRVTPDPSFDCTDVIGKVFDDRNLDGQQDEDEQGTPGVRVVTARGLIATTDEHGRFHITCAVVPDEDRGSNFILKLDDRSLPTGYRLTTENPLVQRATRGKMLRYNFGATIHRVVSVDISEGIFEPNRTELRLQWTPKFLQLMAELRKAPAVLRLSYLADIEAPGLVQARLKAMKKEVVKHWALSDGGYPLNIETEVFWRRGGPP